MRDIFSLQGGGIHKNLFLIEVFLMKLSLVVPCFNEEENITVFFDACRAAFDTRDFDYEIVFVDDGSADKTWKIICGLCKGSKKVKGISFSRNFGKEAAMYAGINESRGEYTATIDADMQQRPESVVKMLEFLENNTEYDAVTLFQTKRCEGRFITMCKKWFYRSANVCLGVRLKAGASDFRMLRRTAADAFLTMPEHMRFSKGIFPWLGFKTFYMPYAAEPRSGGKSSWSFFKLLRYAVSGFVSFSYLPLRIISVLGAALLLCSAAALVYMLFSRRTLVSGAGLAFFAFLMSGTQLGALGIIGEYIAQISIESKKRPLYIIRERAGDKLS